MDMIPKPILAVVMWLTAAMTLVAGMPHFVCRCAGGSVRPFCFGIRLNLPLVGCGAGRDCCPPECEPADKGSSCCDRHRAGCPHCKAAAKAADSPQEVGRPGCSRSPADKPVFAVSGHRAPIAGDNGLGLSVARSATEAGIANIVQRRRFSWQIYLLAPPTDLTITLLHLVI
jgi:hypothetical protein